jgi:hypothetical protein
MKTNSVPGMLLPNSFEPDLSHTSGLTIIVAGWILFLIGVGVSIAYGQEPFDNSTRIYDNMTKLK